MNLKLIHFVVNWLWNVYSLWVFFFFLLFSPSLDIVEKRISLYGSKPYDSWIMLWLSAYLTIQSTLSARSSICVSIWSLFQLIDFSSHYRSDFLASLCAWIFLVGCWHCDFTFFVIPNNLNLGMQLNYPEIVWSFWILLWSFFRQTRTI